MAVVLYGKYYHRLLFVLYVFFRWNVSLCEIYYNLAREQSGEDWYYVWPYRDKNELEYELEWIEFA